VNAAFVIIQHMEGRFSPGLADWLQQSARLKVKLVEHKEKAVAGVVYIAGSDLHLQISAEGRLLYVEDPKDSLFRPSIDVFFTSLSKNWRGVAIGVLLTGMGQDGAQGMKLMKDKGWHTIAQDQASSAVYGMPKAAVLLHAVTEVLPLNSIAARLISLCHNL
jgi:two-component system response regulator WspF